MEPSHFLSGDGATRTMGVAAESKGVGKAGGLGKKSIPKTKPEEATAASEAVFENPLVPHAVLRQMYRAIVELRLLEELGLKQTRGRKAAIVLREAMGQEACRVSLTLGLSVGDLVMEAQPGGLTEYLLGTELKAVVAALRGATGGRSAKKGTASVSRLLPFVEDAETRLVAGLGVALLARQMQRPDGVVIFVREHEVARKVWRKTLKLAAEQVLPVIFVVLPETGRAKAKPETAALASRCGVPGIPVDGSDTVALYRVAQESLGRIRSGGGPVLIEGVAFPFGLPKGRKSLMNHPITTLASYLIQRKVADAAWLSGVEIDFRSKLTKMTRILR